MFNLTNEAKRILQRWNSKELSRVEQQAILEHMMKQVQQIKEA
jgi:hypothetical protein